VAKSRKHQHIFTAKLTLIWNIFFEIWELLEIHILMDIETVSEIAVIRILMVKQIKKFFGFWILQLAGHILRNWYCRSESELEFW
jgi:hypothetical protein